MSFHQNRTSAVVTALPSDHFKPLRRLKVHVEASAFVVHLVTTPGATSCPSLTKRSMPKLYQSSPTDDESPPEVATMFMPIRPPYLPFCTQLCGTT
jgi:hypothetical protein